MDDMCDVSGEIVTSRGPERCRRCRDNEGVCFHRSKDDNDYESDGEPLCICPLSRTGDLCETIRGCSTTLSWYIGPFQLRRLWILWRYEYDVIESHDAIDDVINRRAVGTFLYLRSAAGHQLVVLTWPSGRSLYSVRGCGTLPMQRLLRDTSHNTISFGHSLKRFFLSEY